MNTTQKFRVGIVITFLIMLQPTIAWPIVKPEARSAAIQQSQQVKYKTKDVRTGFSQATQCGVYLAAFFNGEGVVDSDQFDILDIFLNILRANALKTTTFKSSISIQVMWTGMGTYMDSIIVKTDKTDTSLFSPKSLKAFRDTIEHYRETLSNIADSKLSDRIIVALKMLQKHKKEKIDETFICSKCGRNLTVTLSKLMLIFPNNSNIMQEHATLFTDALKRGGFNTCNRHAHFFSQVTVETGEFKEFVELSSYRFLRIYEVFGKQTENDSYKTLYNQSLWNENRHLNYIGVNASSHLYENKQLAQTITNKNKRYIGEGSITKSRNGYSITFPDIFKKDTIGTYIKKTVTNAVQAGQNLFNVVYENKNGNINADDGYKYRGRGAIHVTGRGNYRDISNKCNSVFSKNFDWETNYEQLAKNLDAIIYSAVGWFLSKYNSIDVLDNMNSKQVTHDVNTKGEGESDREEKYNSLTNNSQLYNCQPKNK